MIRNALIASLIVIAALRFVMVFTFEINWDEFLNLSMLYDHRRGELREILQTGFVHLLHWVPHVSVNEVEQIYAARLLVYGAAILTSLAIFNIARALTTRDCALAAVLCYWAFSFNLQHGVSLRTDPLAATAMTCALWAAIAAPLSWRRAALAGICGGLAGLFTIKGVFYVPALVLVVFVQGARNHMAMRGLACIVVMGLFGLATFFGSVALHALSFTEFASPLAFLDRTTGATLGAQSHSALAEYGGRALRENIIPVLLLALGAMLALWRITKTGQRRDAILAIALLTPALSFLVYSETYPYYFPFIMPPLMIAAAIGFEAIARKLGNPGALALILALLVSGGATFYTSLAKPTKPQRDTLAAIHTLFPVGTPYIDARSMVSSMAKRGVFMSRWGMTDYRAQNTPIMRDLLVRDRPGFVLASGPQLDLIQRTPAGSEAHPLGLLAEDLVVLQDNYVPFWGPLYVPGKQITPATRALEILLPGVYILRSEAALVLDGTTLSPGARISLQAGRVSVAASTAASLVRDLAIPTQDPPSGPLFSSF